MKKLARSPWRGLFWIPVILLAIFAAAVIGVMMDSAVDSEFPLNTILALIIATYPGIIFAVTCVAVTVVRLYRHYNEKTVGDPAAGEMETWKIRLLMAAKGVLVILSLFWGLTPFAAIYPLLVLMIAALTGVQAMLDGVTGIRK